MIPLRAPWRLGLLLVAAGLGACAAVPQDRGMPQVQTLLQTRGYDQVASPGADQTGQLAKQILAAGPLSADDAVRVALLENPALQATYARLGFSAADVYDAGRLANPVLSASVQFTGNSGDVNRYDYGLTQNFLGLLLLPARSRLARTEFERTQQEAGAAVIDLAGQVRVAYQRLVGAIQVQRMREMVADAADTSAQLAQRYYDAGNIPELELELQRSAAGQAQAEAVGAGNEAQAARADLGNLLGLTDQQNWRVPERLQAPLAQQESLAELQAAARQGRLDLLAKRREVSLLEDALGVTRSWRLLGDVDLGVQGERDDDGAHLLGPALSIQLPIFNQGQGAVLRAQSRLELSRAELRRMETEADNAIQLAQVRVASTQALAQRYTSEYIPLQERIVRHTQERANFMLVGPFELIRARQQEYDTYQKYIETVRDYWMARAELERAVGARLPGDRQAAASPTQTLNGIAAGGQP